MNIVLWVLQILLSIHTLTGAIWKFSNSPEKTMPSLKSIPLGIWQAMSVFEILLSICLVLTFYKPLSHLVPIASGFIAFEMLLFCVLHLASGDKSFAPMIYWLVVAALCGFIAYGRFVLRP